MLYRFCIFQFDSMLDKKKKKIAFERYHYYIDVLILMFCFLHKNLLDLF